MQLQTNITNHSNKNIKFYLVLFLWIIWIAVSLFVINWILKETYIISPSFILSDINSNILKIYLISIPLTTLVACKGEIRRIKNDFANVIIFNLLIAFFFYCFYEFRFAYFGGADLSYETVYGFNEMTAFEYNIYYVEAVKSFYFAALSRTIFIGLLLSIAFFVCKKLKK